MLFCNLQIGHQDAPGSNGAACSQGQGLKREVHARSLIIGPRMCQQDCSMMNNDIVCEASQPTVSTSGGIIPHALIRMVTRDLQIVSLGLLYALSWSSWFQTLDQITKVRKCLEL